MRKALGTWNGPGTFPTLDQDVVIPGRNAEPKLNQLAGLKSYFSSPSPLTLRIGVAVSASENHKAVRSIINPSEQR